MPARRLPRSAFFFTARSPATCSTAPRTRFAKGAVRRCSRPPDNHQKNVENKQSDRDVVEQCRLRQIRPELIGRPEQKGNSQHDRLHKFHCGWPMRNLVDQVRKSDHSQRKSGKDLMTSRWKAPRSDIPGQQSRDARKRDGPESGSKESLASDKTRVHK
jgi:hypothetical protein